jgi:hypothetical protein
MWSAILAGLGMIVPWIQSLSGLSTAGIIAASLTLLISLWKSSALQPLWAMIPASVQTWVAPLMAIVIALGGMPSLSWASLWVAIQAGLGSGMLAIALHDLLDTVKTMPWVSGPWVTVINFIEGFLGAPPATKTVRGQRSTKLAA